MSSLGAHSFCWFCHVAAQIYQVCEVGLEFHRFDLFCVRSVARVRAGLGVGLVRNMA